MIPEGTWPRQVGWQRASWPAAFRPLCIIYFLLFFLIYVPATEWTLVYQGWLRIDPALLFLILIAPLFLGLLLTALDPTREDLGMIGVYRENAAVIFCFASLSLLSLGYSLHSGSSWEQNGKYAFAVTFD